MPDALVGYTGFVGSNLLRQRSFDDLYRSTNVDDIAGRRYDLLVCAGAPAEKWKANADPDGDRASLARLERALARVEARQVIAISTVDVYPRPEGVDESSPIDLAALAPYGRHRRQLELFLAERFPTLVVRLPGLFGPGLKKNVVFDMMHGHRLEHVHADARFQFYDLAWLWADTETAMALRVPVVNFATEPVSVGDVAREAFGREFGNRPPAVPARYDVRSEYAPAFGGRGGYLRSRDVVLARMRDFVADSVTSA